MNCAVSAIKKMDEQAAVFLYKVLRKENSAFLKGIEDICQDLGIEWHPSFKVTMRMSMGREREGEEVIF
jgi:hypothetical protein